MRKLMGEEKDRRHCLPITVTGKTDLHLLKNNLLPIYFIHLGTEKQKPQTLKQPLPSHLSHTQLHSFRLLYPAQCHRVMGNGGVMVRT